MRGRHIVAWLNARSAHCSMALGEVGTLYHGFIRVGGEFGTPYHALRAGASSADGASSRGCNEAAARRRMGAETGNHPMGRRSAAVSFRQDAVRNIAFKQKYLNTSRHAFEQCAVHRARHAG